MSGKHLQTFLWRALFYTITILNSTPNCDSKMNEWLRFYWIPSNLFQQAERLTDKTWQDKQNLTISWKKLQKISSPLWYNMYKCQIGWQVLIRIIKFKLQKFVNLNEINHVCFSWHCQTARHCKSLPDNYWALDTWKFIFKHKPLEE